jgi:hypothetical protein
VNAAPPAAAAAVPEPPGLLQVAVKPWATVWIDGRAMGETPLGKIELAAGPHSLRVRHPAYEPWEKTVTVRSGQTERIVVDLEREGVRKRD